MITNTLNKTPPYSGRLLDYSKTIITMSILKIDGEYEGRYYIDGKQDEYKTVYEDSLQACKDTLHVTFLKLHDLIEYNIREDLNLSKDSSDFIQKTFIKFDYKIPPSNEWEIETFTRFIPKFWI